MIEQFMIHVPSDNAGDVLSIVDSFGGKANNLRHWPDDRISYSIACSSDDCEDVKNQIESAGGKVSKTPVFSSPTKTVLKNSWPQDNNRQRGVGQKRKEYIPEAYKSSIESPMQQYMREVKAQSEENRYRATAPSRYNYRDW